MASALDMVNYILESLLYMNGPKSNNL
jgi:hypothetical protein